MTRSVLSRLSFLLTFLTSTAGGNEMVESSTTKSYKLCSFAKVLRSVGPSAVVILTTESDSFNMV